MRPLVWCQAWLGGPPDTCVCPPPPKKKNYTRAWKHVRRARCQSQRKNFLLEKHRPNFEQGSLCPVDFPPVPDQWNSSRTVLHSWEGSAGNAGGDAVRIPRAPFCRQMREKLFTKTVTRLPNGIALLTSEWRALQQLARQNPVAITWHIKSISAPILTPPHPPFLSLQSWQTFYAYSHVHTGQD